jgi:hypothetical protein
MEERVARWADIDTRRAMGFPPRKLVIPRLEFQKNGFFYSHPESWNYRFPSGSGIIMSRRTFQVTEVDDWSTWPMYVKGRTYAHPDYVNILNRW